MKTLAKILSVTLLATDMFFWVRPNVEAVDITRVQQANATTMTNQNPTVSFPSNVTAGNLLVVGIQTAGATTVVNSVSGSNATYARGSNRAFQSGAAGTEIWYGIATSTGAETVTFHLNGSAAVVMWAREYNAINGWQSSKDGTNTGNSSSGTAMATSNFTTAQANDLIVAIGGAVSGNTISLGTGYSNLQSSGNGAVGAMEEQLNVGAGTYQGLMTNSASSAWEIGAVAFAEKSSSVKALFFAD